MDDPKGARAYEVGQVSFSMTVQPARNKVGSIAAPLLETPPAQSEDSGGGGVMLVWLLIFIACTAIAGLVLGPLGIILVIGIGLCVLLAAGAFALLLASVRSQPPGIQKAIVTGAVIGAVVSAFDGDSGTEGK